MSNNVGKIYFRFEAVTYIHTAMRFQLCHFDSNAMICKSGYTISLGFVRKEM